MNGTDLKGAARRIRRKLRSVAEETRIRLTDRSLEPKIFGLGLSRTGTTSLTVVLRRLGFEIVHFPVDGPTIRELSSGRAKLSLLRAKDGITDITTVPFYKQLDAQYRRSKFILTTRERDSWLVSMEQHLTREHPDLDARKHPDRPDIVAFKKFLRESVYGCDLFDLKLTGAAYDRHHSDVYDYFRNRPDDLLTLDVTSGDRIDKLCRFLDVPEIDEDFPRLNVAPEQGGAGRR